LSSAKICIKVIIKFEISKIISALKQKANKSSSKYTIKPVVTTLQTSSKQDESISPIDPKRSQKIPKLNLLINKYVSSKDSISYDLNTTPDEPKS
jgi:hypothetical protein